MQHLSPPAIAAQLTLHGPQALVQTIIELSDHLRTLSRRQRAQAARIHTLETALSDILITQADLALAHQPLAGQIALSTDLGDAQTRQECVKLSLDPNMSLQGNRW